MDIILFGTIGVV